MGVGNEGIYRCTTYILMYPVHVHVYMYTVPSVHALPVHVLSVHALPVYTCIARSSIYNYYDLDGYGTAVT